MTIDTLAKAAGVSVSCLSRVETGSRFPSAKVLKKIAKPLGFNEKELFVIAGFLSADSAEEGESNPVGKLDREVATLLAREPVEVQRTVIHILFLLKEIAGAQSKLK